MEHLDADGFAGTLLRAMAEAYPDPVHFGYLGLQFGMSGAAMFRTLRQLRLDGLLRIDRKLACSDLPYAQLRISAKGMAVAAGLAQAESAADSLRGFDATTLAKLQQMRLGAVREPRRSAPPALSALVNAGSDRPCP
jgi:hypothetical protein